MLLFYNDAGVLPAVRVRHCMALDVSSILFLCCSAFLGELDALSIALRTSLDSRSRFDIFSSSFGYESAAGNTRWLTQTEIGKNKFLVSIVAVCGDSKSVGLH